MGYWEDLDEVINSDRFPRKYNTPELLSKARDIAFSEIENDPDWKITPEDQRVELRKSFNKKYDDRYPHASVDYGEWDATKDIPDLLAYGTERGLARTVSGGARFIGSVSTELDVSESAKDLIFERNEIDRELGDTGDIVSGVSSGGMPSVPMLQAAHEARKRLTPERKAELEKRRSEIDKEISHKKTLARQDSLAWNIAEGVDKWVREELPLGGTGLVFSGRGKINPNAQDTIIGQVGMVAGEMPATMLKAYALGPQMAAVGLFADNTAQLFEESYQVAKSSGSTDDEAIQTAMTASVPAALLDTVADVKTVGKIADKIIGKVTKKEAMREIIKSGLIEGSTEVAQDKVMQLATNLYGENVNTGDLFSVDDFKTFLVASIVGTASKGVEMSVRKAQGHQLTEEEINQEKTAESILDTSMKNPALKEQAVGMAKAQADKLKEFIKDSAGSDEAVAAEVRLEALEKFIQDPEGFAQAVADKAEAEIENEDVVVDQKDPSEQLKQEDLNIIPPESISDDALTTTALNNEAVETVEFPVSEVVVNKDVPQFKEDGDFETGVVDPLQGKYERVGTAPIVLWEKSNGETEVVTGRHRLDLARRSGEKTIPAQVLKESDGWGLDRVLTLDAESNIRDGQGTVKDYASYFKNTNITTEEAGARGLLSRSKGKAGYALGKQASPDLYAGYALGSIPETKAVAIAQGAPNNPGAQLVAIKKVKSLDPDSLRYYAQRINMIELNDDGTLRQQSLFSGDEELARWEKEAEAMAKATTKLIKEAKDKISAVQGAVKRPEAARKMGVDVSNPELVASEMNRLQERIALLENPDEATLNEIRETAGLKTEKALTEDPHERLQLPAANNPVKAYSSEGNGFVAESQVSYDDREQFVKGINDFMNLSRSDFGKMYKNGVTVMNRVPDLLRFLGVSDSRVVVKSDILNKIMKDKSKGRIYSSETVSNIYDGLMDPLLILDSWTPHGQNLRDTTKLIVTTFEDPNFDPKKAAPGSKPGFMTVVLRAEKIGKDIEINDVVSFYDIRSSKLKDGISAGYLNYANEKAFTVLRSHWLQLPTTQDMVKAFNGYIPKSIWTESKGRLLDSDNGMSVHERDVLKQYQKVAKEGIPLTIEQLKQYEGYQLSSGEMSVFKPVKESDKNKFLLDKTAYIESKQDGRVLFEPDPEVLAESYCITQGILDFGIQRGVLGFFDKLSTAREAVRHVDYSRIATDAERGALLEDFDGNIKAIVDATEEGNTVRAFADDCFQQNISGWNPMGKVIRGAEDFAILAMELSNPHREILKCAIVDESGMIVHAGVLSVGNIDKTIFDVRQVGNMYRQARNRGVQGKLTVYMSHNHPSGNVKPSSADYNCNAIIDNYITELSQSEHVDYGDHIVTNGVSYYSLNQDRKSNLKDPKKFAWEYADRTSLKQLSRGSFDGLVNSLRQSSTDGRFVIFTNHQYKIVGIKQISKSLNSEVAGIALDASNLGADGVFYVGKGVDELNLGGFREDLKTMQVELYDVNTDKVTSFQAARREFQNVAEVREDSPLYLDPRDAAMEGMVSVPVGDLDIQMSLGGMSSITPLRMPELAELAEILSGKSPELRGSTRWRGCFSGAKKLIMLNPLIFADRSGARRTLAHEIGHLCDFIPDDTLARGNILGRIKSLKHFMGDVTNIDGSIVKKDDIITELKALSKWWRPWNPKGASRSEKNYRNSSKELYADAVSVLLSAPHELRAQCPLFWDAFLRTLKQKEAVALAYFDIQMATGNDTLLADRRLDRQRAGYQAGWDYLARSFEVKKADSPETAMDYINHIVAKGRSVWRGTLRALQNTHAEAIALEKDYFKRLDKEGVTVDYENSLELAVDDYNNRDSSIRLWSYQTLNEILPALKTADIDTNDFGQYMENLRRAHIDPEGGTIEVLDNQEAQGNLDRLREKVGEEKYAKMVVIARKFSDRIFEVMSKARESGLVSDAVWEQVEKNRYTYFTFMTEDHISDTVTGTIKNRKGTLKKIVNPLYSTIAKMIAVQQLTERNTISKKLADTLNNGGVLEPAKIKSYGSYTMAVPAPKGKSILKYWENGKIKYFYTDSKYTKGLDSGLARAFQESKALTAVNAPFKYLFYPAFISANIKFMGLTSPVRDISLAFLSQGYKAAGKQTASYLRNFTILLTELATLPLPENVRNEIVDFVTPSDPYHPLRASRDFLRGNMDNPLVSEMVEARALFGSNHRMNHRDATTLDILKSLGYDPLAESADVGKLEKAWKGIQSVHDSIEYMGATFEQSARIGAYFSAKEKGKSVKLASHFARNYAATPNITRKGEWTRLSNTVVPFSNVFIQGLDSRTFGLLFGKDRGLNKSDTVGALFRLSQIVALGTIWTLAELGAFDDESGEDPLSKLFGYIPDSDRANYFCIPYGWSEDDKGRKKAKYFRIPMDETIRMIWGLNRRIVQQVYAGDKINADIIDAGRDMLSFGAGQTPGLNPLITIGSGLATYTAGGNPIDPFTQKPVLNADEEALRGSAGANKMTWWTLKKSGIGNFVQYDPYARDGQSWTLKDNAALILGVKSIMRESDFGMREEEMRADQAKTRQRTERKMMLNDKARDLAREYSVISAKKADRRTEWEKRRFAELKPFNKAYRTFLDADGDEGTINQISEWINDAAEGY